MIRGIIISSIGGICLFYKNYGYNDDLLANHDLICNFLSANNIFADKMIQKKMQIIKMTDNTHFIFEQDIKNKLMFVLISDSNYHLFNLQLKLSHIKYIFLNNFSHLLNNNGKHPIIPEQEVEKLIDPIILGIRSFGNIATILKSFGVKETATLYSSLLSKRNILITGEERESIENVILSIPQLLPFREFFISNTMTPIENIGLLVPYLDNINFAQLPDYCWWIVGTNNYKPKKNKNTVHVNFDNKTISNAVLPSVFENDLIKQIDKLKDTEAKNYMMANKILDLLNNIKKLQDFDVINEEVLKLNNLKPSLLPIIKKIIELDFYMEKDFRDDYYSKRFLNIFGGKY